MSFEPCLCGDPECGRCFSQSRDWLILCRAPHVGVDALCVWWRADRSGYTHRLDEAGRWTEEQARRFASQRDLPVSESTVLDAAISVVRRGAMGVDGETETHV